MVKCNLVSLTWGRPIMDPLCSFVVDGVSYYSKNAVIVEVETDVNWRLT